ncbi:MAG TPA: acyltransferase [Terracidiphilus sp.]|jgi:peptidoglycan/LPS O-acetylase OafA/YrhL
MPGSNTHARKANGEYIYGVDLVRFACAVSVAAFHLTWMTAGIAWFMPFGWVGVQVFFVISGLVIANSAQGASARQFLTGRFLRIYPTAWCAAIVSYPLFLWEFPKMADRLQRLYFSIVLFPGPFIATAYWTLPIELSFYFVVYSLIVFNGFRYIRSLAILLILWGAPYLAALALNAHGSVHWGWVNFQYIWENMSLLRYGPYFGLGIVVWLYKEKRLGKAGLLAAGLALVLALMEIYAKAQEILPNFARSAGTQTPWTHLATASNLAFCAAFAAILLSVKFNHRFPANAEVRRAVRLLGLTTYPFYLLHERVGAFVIYQTSRFGLAHLPGVMVALISIGALSLFIAYYCEPALRSLLKKIGRLANPAPKNPAFEAH